ncbi:MAG TPA: universal stress protein, partial [Polyangiaceae bacterium]|nr:universal stress protein [Polyangiaceae bacterium]
RAYELASTSIASEIHALFVVRDAGAAASLRMDDGLSKLTKHVNSLLVSLGGIAPSGMRVYSHFRVDAPAFGIIQLAAEVGATSIFVGSHGRDGVAPWQLGSVAEGVLRQATCPVSLIPPASMFTGLPKLTPVCVHCLEVRRRSGRRELWCEQHRDGQGRWRMSHQRERSSDDASSSLRLR